MSSYAADTLAEYNKDDLIRIGWQNGELLLFIFIYLSGRKIWLLLVVARSGKMWIFNSLSATDDPIIR